MLASEDRAGARARSRARARPDCEILRSKSRETRIRSRCFADARSRRGGEDRRRCGPLAKCRSDARSKGWQLASVADVLRGSRRGLRRESGLPTAATRAGRERGPRRWRFIQREDDRRALSRGSDAASPERPKKGGSFGVSPEALRPSGALLAIARGRKARVEGGRRARFGSGTSSPAGAGCDSSGPSSSGRRRAARAEEVFRPVSCRRLPNVSYSRRRRTSPRSSLTSPS